jgi:hypothetical protein
MFLVRSTQQEIVAWSRTINTGLQLDDDMMSYLQDCRTVIIDVSTSVPGAAVNLVSGAQRPDPRCEIAAGGSQFHDALLTLVHN